MKLTQLSDEKLAHETERLAHQERELLVEILWHLQEIDRRRLYSSLGYKSLFDYAVKKLRYAQDQAYRRISAARLMREIPEIEPKIHSGTLTLTHIGMAKIVFKREKFSLEEKAALLKKLENTSTREAAKILAAISPEALKPDAIRPLAADRVEMRFVANESLLEKIEKLKGLFAHRYPHLSLGELFEVLCDQVIENQTKFAAPQISKRQSVAARRRAVLARGRCEKCDSRHALEVDHRVPKALGGKDTIENLRLLCRSCNQRAAIEIFGIDKMEKYLT
ncbi:MAG: HNH endonuclease [Bacteriovoracia bacterium]